MQHIKDEPEYKYDPQQSPLWNTYSRFGYESALRRIMEKLAFTDAQIRAHSDARCGEIEKWHSGRQATTFGT